MSCTPRAYCEREGGSAADLQALRFGVAQLERDGLVRKRRNEGRAYLQADSSTVDRLLAGRRRDLSSPNDAPAAPPSLARVPLHRPRRAPHSSPHEVLAVVGLENGLGADLTSNEGARLDLRGLEEGKNRGRRGSEGEGEGDGGAKRARTLVGELQREESSVRHGGRVRRETYVCLDGRRRLLASRKLELLLNRDRVREGVAPGLRREGDREFKNQTARDDEGQTMLGRRVKEGIRTGRLTSRSLSVHPQARVASEPPSRPDRIRPAPLLA